MEVLATSGSLDTVTDAFKKIREAINRLAETNPQLLKFATLGFLITGALSPVGFLLGGVASGFTALAAGGACLPLSLQLLRAAFWQFSPPLL
jgi:hypothetical protein